jgi:hypothetical protein
MENTDTKPHTRWASFHVEKALHAKIKKACPVGYKLNNFAADLFVKGLAVYKEEKANERKSGT